MDITRLNGEIRPARPLRNATRAARADKRVVGLETLEFQLGLFDSLPFDMQTEFLLASLREQSGMATQIESMIAAWKDGDSAALAAAVNQELAREPELYEALIVDRNLRWLEAIREWLQRDEDVLLVVGAGHLVGEDGLVRLLTKEGVRVTQR